MLQGGEPNKRSTSSATLSTLISLRQGGRSSGLGGDGHSSKKRSRQGEHSNDAEMEMCAAPWAQCGEVRSGLDGP